MGPRVVLVNRAADPAIVPPVRAPGRRALFPVDARSFRWTGRGPSR